MEKIMWLVLGGTAFVAEASRGVVGFGVGRRGSVREGAIGEIFGVNGQALTEEEPTDGLVPVCRVRAARGVPCR